jgi:acetyl-CoA carboxylase biotin carboxylase subunit
MTTNIDLVEEQLKIATTSSLELSQNEIHINGWAINCRINAEDPRNFAPSPGTVIHYHPPTGPGVRVDSALFSGYTIPEYYDSMVAKLATRGRGREEAIQRMRVALDEIEIAGVPTTIPLHKLLMHDEGFIQGNFDTTYLNSILPQLNSNLLRLEKFAAVAAATCRLGNPARPPAHETDEASKWRTWARAHHMLGHGG